MHVPCAEGTVVASLHHSLGVRIGAKFDVTCRLGFAGHSTCQPTAFRGEGWAPIHDHVDWLGVDVVGDDFGVFAEKVKDCVGGGVPGDLSSTLPLSPVGGWGRGATLVILTTAQSMRLASLLRSWKGMVSFASSMTAVSPIPGVNCVPRQGRDCGVYISGNRKVAILLTIYVVRGH